MKIELRKVLYLKEGKIIAEPHPDSDLLLIMAVSTRRKKKRHIAYNAHTKETYQVEIRAMWATDPFTIDSKLERIHLDTESLEAFDTTLAVFLSEDREVILKPHRISISPTI